VIARRGFSQGLAAAALLPAAGVARAQAPGPRLVTVGGGITEVVYRLGAERLLVGTDTTSLHPEAATRTPKVGYARQLSAEGLLSLKPEVLVAGEEAGPPVVIEQLRGAGVRVELVRASHDFAELEAKVQAVGRATGRAAEATALLATLRSEFTAATARADAAAAAWPKRPKVLFVLAHAQAASVSGEGTAADAMLRLAGGVNVIGGFTGYRPMTAEAVVGAAPDIVLTTQQAISGGGGEAAFWQRPGLSLTPAARRRALIAPEALFLLGFGPRLPQAVAELSAAFAQAMRTAV
jgi:iron complex transport system substrate-binding protein